MKAHALKQLICLLGFFLCCNVSAKSQDTLRLKSGRIILAHLIEINPEYLHYTLLDSSDKAIYSIARNKVSYFSKSTLTQAKLIRESSVFAGDSQDSVSTTKKTLSLGIVAVVVSNQPLLYLRFKLNQRSNLWLSGGYIFQGYCQQNSILSLVDFAGITKFSGPDFQFGISKNRLHRRGKYKRVTSMSFLYDMRIKNKPKHIWYEGSPGLGQEMQQIRSEFIIAHNFILLFSKSLRFSPQLHLAFFAGGGIQVNQIKAKLYSYGYGSNPEAEKYPENTFSKEGTIDLCIRIGASLSYDFHTFNLSKL